MCFGCTTLKGLNISVSKISTQTLIRKRSRYSRFTHKIEAAVFWHCRHAFICDWIWRIQIFVALQMCFCKQPRRGWMPWLSNIDSASGKNVVAYSLRNDLTGFTDAALMVRDPMVIAAIRPMINPARTNTPTPGLIRYAKSRNHCCMNRYATGTASKHAIMISIRNSFEIIPTMLWTDAPNTFTNADFLNSRFNRKRYEGEQTHARNQNNYQWEYEKYLAALCIGFIKSFEACIKECVLQRIFRSIVLLIAWSFSITPGQLLVLLWVCNNQSVEPGYSELQI